MTSSCGYFSDFEPPSDNHATDRTMYKNSTDGESLWFLSVLFLIISINSLKILAPPLFNTPPLNGSKFLLNSTWIS